MRAEQHATARSMDTGRWPTKCRPACHTARHPPDLLAHPLDDRGNLQHPRQRCARDKVGGCKAKSSSVPSCRARTMRRTHQLEPAHEHSAGVSLHGTEAEGIRPLQALCMWCCDLCQQVLEVDLAPVTSESRASAAARSLLGSCSAQPWPGRLQYR